MVFVSRLDSVRLFRSRNMGVWKCGWCLSMINMVKFLSMMSVYMVRYMVVLVCSFVLGW